MRHLSFRSLAPALFAVLLALTGATQAADPVKVKFAAGPTGTTWYAYAGALRTEMLNGLPQGSTVDILGTPMAIANTKLLTAKRTDVALIFRRWRPGRSAASARSTRKSTISVAWWAAWISTTSALPCRRTATSKASPTSRKASWRCASAPAPGQPQ